MLKAPSLHGFKSGDTSAESADGHGRQQSSGFAFAPPVIAHSQPIENRTYRLVSGCYPPDRPYDVDIIILTLNRFAETMEAVNSSLAQRGVSFHVTVLDQGSDPYIRACYLRAFLGKPNFGYVVTAKNLGVGGGRNLLAALGHGRIIVALDNDAAFESDTVVARAVNAFTLTPALGALGFRILSRDGVHLDDLSWGYPRQLQSRADQQFDTTTFVGAGHAIRRSAWNATGGYDPSLFFTWEEYDFCLTAISLGWVVRYDGSLAVIHKVSPEARIAWNSSRIRYSIRNRLVIARKWGKTWPGLAPRLCGYLVKGLHNHCLMATIQGIFLALRTQTSHAHAMSPEMHDYLVRNEQRHRGSLLTRIRSEVLRKIDYRS